MHGFRWYPEGTTVNARRAPDAHLAAHGAGDRRAGLAFVRLGRPALYRPARWREMRRAVAGAN